MVLAKNPDIKPGYTTLFVPGVTIESSTLNIRSSSNLYFGTRAGRIARRSAGDALVGSRSVLVVRVVTQDSKPSKTAAQIGVNVFGGNGDKVNLKSQMEGCSNNQLLIEKAVGKGIVEGTVEVSVNEKVSKHTSDTLAEIALEELAKDLGIDYDDLSSIADHIMVCLPSGTKGSWVAYGYIDHYLTVYNNDWCNMPSAQLHELGHNFVSI